MMQLVFSSHLLQKEIRAYYSIYNFKQSHNLHFFYKTLSLLQLVDFYDFIVLVLLIICFEKDYFKSSKRILKILLLKTMGALLQIVLKEVRPYWLIDNDHFKFDNCFRTFVLPDDNLFDFLMFLFTLFLFMDKRKWWNVLALLASVLYLGTVGFFLIVDGQMSVFQFIVNITLTVALILFLGMFDGIIANILEHHTIHKKHGKKSFFKFAYFLLGMAFMKIVIMYTISNDCHYPQIISYKKCVLNNGEEIPTDNSFTLLGKYPTFKNSNGAFSFLGFFIGLLLLFHDLENTKINIFQQQRHKALKMMLIFLVVLVGLSIVTLMRVRERWFDNISFISLIAENLVWFSLYFLAFGGINFLFHKYEEKEPKSGRL